MLALQLKNVQWDFPQAETAYRRALALDPNNTNAIVEFADLLWETGRLVEAEAEVRKARWRLPNLAVLAAKDAEIKLARGRSRSRHRRGGGRVGDPARLSSRCCDGGQRA